MFKKAQELQNKIEITIHYFIKKNGLFTVGLFGFSLIALGFVEIMNYVFIMKDIMQLNKPVNLFFSPLTHLFCGFCLIILIIINKK